MNACSQSSLPNAALEKLPQTRVFVIDSHRPLHASNVADANDLVCVLRDEREQVPGRGEESFPPPESDGEESSSDEDDEEERADSDDDGEGAQNSLSPRPQPSLACRSRHRRHRDRKNSVTARREPRGPAPAH